MSWPPSTPTISSPDSVPTAIIERSTPSYHKRSGNTSTETTISERLQDPRFLGSSAGSTCPLPHHLVGDSNTVVGNKLTHLAPSAPRRTRAPPEPVSYACRTCLHLTRVSTHSGEPLTHTAEYARDITWRTRCRRQPEQDTPPMPHSAPASSFPVIVFQTMPARKRCTDAI